MTLLPRRSSGEEARASVQPDGVGEQRKPQAADDGRQHQIGIGSRKEQRGEEHRRRAQPEAADLHLTQQRADPQEDRNEQHR